MTFLSDLAGMLAMRVESLRLQAERRTVVCGILCFSAGFLAYVLLRNYVYAALPELMNPPSGPLQYIIRLNLVQNLVFISWVYIPVLILLGNAISGEVLGLSVSGREYRMHLSALLPLWGLIYLIASPVQWIVPHFIIVGMFEVSIGFLIRSLLLLVYTVWAIKHLNFMTTVQAAGVFILSWFTLPLLYLLIYADFMLMAVILVVSVPYIVSLLLRFRAHRLKEASLQRYLDRLHSNPEDGDACFQSGKILLNLGNIDEAAEYFERAYRIKPENPDYGYYLGRTYEKKMQWNRALPLYEGIYRENPEYASGDICRELGNTYIHTDNFEKGIALLTLFLENRGTDLEGRYRLAEALSESGKTAQMTGELNEILKQFRAGSRLFRKANRQWACGARDLLRQSRASESL